MTAGMTADSKLPSRPKRGLLTPTMAVVVAAVGTGTLLSCGEEPPVAAIKKAEPEKYTKPFVPGDTKGKEPPKVAFADATPGSGLDFVHVTGAYGLKYLPETMGSGVALIDYDKDGLQDVFCVQGAEWPGHEKLTPAPTCKLFKNLGGLKFRDVSKETGLDLALLGMGAAVADYDGDGDSDLFVTALGPCRLMRNDSGHFTDVSDASGMKTPTWTDKEGRVHSTWSTGAAWLDYDCDGTLDLFICSYVHWSIENDVYETLTGSTKAYTIPTKYDSDCCRLWRGKGDGTFEDVTAKAGIERTDSKSLGVSVADVNDDGRPDLAVSNDTQRNYLFVSQPGGGYLEQANDAGIAFDEVGRARAGMGIDCADLCNDGRLVISIGNFSGEPVSMYAQTNEKLFFVDRAGAMRVGPPTNLSLTFAIVFHDYDLDGCLDMLVCNGHIEPEISTKQKEWSYEEPTQLFWNRGDGTFADVSATSGEVLTHKVVARGAAVGDLDGDGDLDTVMTQNGRPAVLVRNDQALNHGWIRVRPKGSGKNRDAIGATITLVHDGKTLRRDVRTGSSYLSQSDIAPTFGLGAAAGATTAPVAIEVHWPSGKRERFEGLAPNREHAVTEGQGKPVK